ncbi:hypothetical protein B0H10DRAFT_2445847 [Mycena sp. CBHHK59/15]|nr:hypothetical protein B0H10DRAFT_2445847 [Mycena sp. CBHHK59/15]
MCLLRPRYACAACPSSARCAAFVASDTDPQTQAIVPRMVPGTSAELCILCGHPWISHEGVPCQDATHPNFSFRRGGCSDSKCGGFFSDELRWAFLTRCICLAAWMSHNLVPDSDPGSASTSRPSTVPTSALIAPPPHAPPAPSSALSVSAPLAFTTYAGVPPVVLGSTGTRRISSALRTLPHNQVASTSTVNHHVSRRGYPAGANPFSTNRTLTVVVYPMVIPVTVPRTGLTSIVDFTTQVVAALALHGLSFAPLPETITEAAAGEFSNQSWALLQPNRRTDIITFTAHPTININNFGIDEFTKLGKKFKNPDPAAGPEGIIRHGSRTSPALSTVPNLPSKTCREDQTLCGRCHPWLMLAACFGRRAMLIPKQYLAALDPIAFDFLAPWLMLELEDPIPTNLRHPLCQFLINHMDMQPSMIASPHSPQLRKSMGIPEFRAIQYGVDIPIGTSSFSMRLVSDNNVLPLPACMYDSQVCHVEDVTSHIDCSILMSATDGTTPYYGALFCLLLLRYLDGVGHPLELRGGVVGEDEWSKHINDPLCRVKLFLEAISDNNLLPAIESWQINLHFVGLPLTPKMSAETVPWPLHIHTCGYAADVNITPALETMLLSSARVKMDDPTYVSQFDLWLHAQILTVRAPYREAKERVGPRRSTRNRGVSRHPDSPVTFVPPPASRQVYTVDDSSDSDAASNESQAHIHDDLLRDLQVGIEAAGLQHSSTTDSLSVTSEDIAETVILRDSTSPDPFQDYAGENMSEFGFNLMRAETEARRNHRSGDPEDEDDRPTVSSVAHVGGSRQNRADYLVEQIVRLQGREPTHPVHFPASFLSPVGPPRITGLVSTTFTALQDDRTQSLYFVGIQSLEQCRTFCQMRAFPDSAGHNGAIFQRLRAAGGPVGRALAAIVDRAAYFVGTSDQPIDIAQDYANHCFNFREIDSLLVLDNSYDGDIAFLPAPFSDARSTLLQSQRAPENTPVFVLYVYHQHAEPLRGASVPVPAGQSAPIFVPPAVAIAAPVPISQARPISSVPVLPAGNASVVYLLNRFAPEYAELAGWRATAYGSAYNHCLIERQILRLCQSLNIGFLGRNHTPAHIESLIKEAHVLLRRLNRAGTLPDTEWRLFDALEVMLGDRILRVDVVLDRENPIAEAEFTAVRWNITSLMITIRSILNNFANA